MTQDASYLMERLTGGLDVTFDDLLWGAVFCGLLLTAVHLVTMLLTRWGDRAATTKSLVFSVVAHLMCILTLMLLKPPPVFSVPSAKRPEEPIRLRELFVEGEEQAHRDEIGNTPVWERPPVPIEMQLTRLDRLPFDPRPLASPPRRNEPITRPELDVPDLPSRPDEPVVTPKPQDNGITGPPREAAAPLKIDEKTAEARPDVEIPSTSRVRQPVVRTGQLDTEVTRAVNQGAVDRVARELDPSRNLASLETTPDPSGFLQRGPLENAIRRRAGPAPALLPDERIGTTTQDPAESNPGTSGAAPVAPTTARLQTRTPKSRENGTLERLRPERTPSTPAPTTLPPVAVRNSVPLDVPRGGPTPPNALRPNFDAVRSRETTKIPATYRLRSLAHRREIARQFGGTDASERAVEASLRWLALNQNPEGYWDSDRLGAGQIQFDENGVDRQHAGRNADSGLTALAVLAFLGAGYTHEDGQYAAQVDRALRWLVQQQHSDGYLGGEASHYAKMYCHAMATYALAEAYGMQSDPTLNTGLREPIRRAVAYILENQNPRDGGWRYLKGQRSDMSMFGWQLMALKSAEIAGLSVPDEPKQRMIQFLKDRSLGSNHGLAGYREGTPPIPSMTAEALFCKQMFKIKRTNSASVEAVEYLLERLPKLSDYNLYYWYYGTLAMYQYGGKPWRDWNESLRDLLVAEQRTTGEHAGSWDPVGRWGPYGGRVYSTTLATLCLEVYYRFLPLYQMGGRYDGQ